eukprot:EG_transcript_51022
MERQSNSWSSFIPCGVAFLASFLLTTIAIGYFNDGAQQAQLFQPPAITSMQTRFPMELAATHPQKKGAKKAADRRPKKSRPSDINRKPPSYPTWEEPESEYTVIRKASSVASP